MNSENNNFCIKDNILYSKDMDTLYLCADKNKKEISIPETVKYIYPYAFDLCTKLRTIEIPEGVNYIGTGAFAMCKKLKRLTIRNKNAYLGPVAFKGCSKQLKVYSNDGTRLNWKF